MPTLHRSLITPAAITATSAAAAYPASNLALTAVRRSWRSTSAAQQQITLDLGAVKGVASVWVQGANCSALSVEQSANGSAWSAVGVLTCYEDRGQSRRRGYLAVGPATRYLRLTIAAGVPLDGATFWELGTVYLFGIAETAISPLWGYRVRHEFPQIESKLNNGQQVVASTGPSYAVITLDWTARPGEDCAAVARWARAGIVAVDLGYSQQDGDRDLWVVMNQQSERETSRANLVSSRASVELREVV